MQIIDYMPKFRAVLCAIVLLILTATSCSTFSTGSGSQTGAASTSAVYGPAVSGGTRYTNIHKLPKENRASRDYPQLVITDQPEVRAAMRFFMTNSRSAIEQGVIRRQEVITAVAAPFKKRTLPFALLHVPLIESGYRPDVRGSGVSGLWQISSGTAQHYGLSTWYFNDERKDVEKSSEVAAQHFEDLYAKFNDWYLVLAAYNAGSGRVDNAIRAGQSRDFYYLARKGFLPQTTKEYVSKVLALTVICRNPSRYKINSRCGIEQLARS